MRILIGALVLFVANAAHACPPPPDWSRLMIGGRVLVEEYEMVGLTRHSHRVYAVPRDPVIYMYVGSEGELGLPTFTRADGSPIHYRFSATPFSDAPFRFDLEIDSGVVWARMPGHSPQPFVVDNTLRPRTRDVSARLLSWRGREEVVEIDSDAVLFRVEYGDHARVEWNWGRVDWPAEDANVRVVAMYPDGTEEVIRSFAASSPSRPWLVNALALLVFSCAVILARRVAAQSASAS